MRLNLLAALTMLILAQPAFAECGIWDDTPPLVYCAPCNDVACECNTMGVCPALRVQCLLIPQVIETGYGGFIGNWSFNCRIEQGCAPRNPSQLCNATTNPCDPYQDPYYVGSIKTDALVDICYH